MILHDFALSSASYRVRIALNLRASITKHEAIAFARAISVARIT